MSFIGLVQLVSRRNVVGITTAMQVVADGATRQSLESRVATLRWGPLKDLKERKVSGELDGRGEAGSWEETVSLGRDGGEMEPEPG